jgi:hypothetical protein
MFEENQRKLNLWLQEGIPRLKGTTRRSTNRTSFGSFVIGKQRPVFWLASHMASPSVFYFGPGCLFGDGVSRSENTS